MSDSGPGPAAGAMDDLVDRAREAREGAYAPYSGFRVGAAALTSSGETFTGANVENASYSVAICAERVAASRAVSSGHRDIQAVAVVSSAGTPTPPCGVCRQFLFEFDPDMTVVCEGPDGDRRTWTLSDLLPDAFGPRALE